MRYREVEYSLVRTIDKAWRWSVKHERGERVGTAGDQDMAIRSAEIFIDQLLKSKERDSKAQ